MYSLVPIFFWSSSLPGEEKGGIIVFCSLKIGGVDVSWLYVKGFAFGVLKEVWSMGASSSNNLGSYGGASELSSSNQLRLIGPKSVNKNREKHVKKKKENPTRSHANNMVISMSSYVIKPYFHIKMEIFILYDMHRRTS